MSFFIQLVCLLFFQWGHPLLKISPRLKVKACKNWLHNSRWNIDHCAELQLKFSWHKGQEWKKINCCKQKRTICYKWRIKYEQEVVFYKIHQCILCKINITLYDQKLEYNGSFEYDEILSGSYSIFMLLQILHVIKQFIVYLEW